MSYGIMMQSWGGRVKEDKKRIGEVLVEAGIINTMQLSVALGEQRQWGGRLGSIIIKLGFADEEAMAGVLEKQLGQSCISLEDITIPPDVLKRVKVEVARKYGIIPIDYDKGVLTVAMSDPTDLGTLDELGFTLGTRLKPVLALESAIMRAIAFHYEGVAPVRKIPKSILVDVSEDIGVIRDERSRSPHVSPSGVPRTESRPEKKEIQLRATLEALLTLLLEKGVITKEELLRKIKEKSGQN